MNFSGNLTAADAQMAFNIVLGTLTPTFEQECAADCDGNSSVTAGDAQMIFFSCTGGPAGMRGSDSMSGYTGIERID